MDQDYIDIEAHIRQAKRLRDDALGKIITDGWHNLKQRLTRFQDGQARKHSALANPSRFSSFPYLP